MKLKKILALILSFIMIFALTACRKNDDSDAIAENSTNTYIEDDFDVALTEAQSSTHSSLLENAETTTFSTANTETATSTSTTNLSTDASQWTKSKIVEVYKLAAEKSSKVKSQQIITLSDISVNNGTLSGVFQFVKPIISKLLSNNSTETDGITGGFENLVESDVYEAKAYASGNNIAIEMTMVEQVDGARGDALNGTVGHAISVVGDISVVIDQLKDLGLPIEISDEHTSITYNNPIVKVLVDKNGNILNGTWSYTVDICLNNYKVGGTTVDNTSVVLENEITVNGGFNN